MRLPICTVHLRCPEIAVRLRRYCLSVPASGVSGYGLGVLLYAWIASAVSSKTAVELPLVWMPIPFYIVTGTILGGVLLSLIPIYILWKKEALR